MATGKRAADAITFLSLELEENDISAIENTELSFHIFDAASWDTIVPAIRHRHRIYGEVA